MARPISTFPAELTKAGLTEAQVQAAMSGRQPLNTYQKSAFKKYLQRLGGKGPSAKIALPLLLAMGMFGMMGSFISRRICPKHWCFWLGKWRKMGQYWPK